MIQALQKWADQVCNVLAALFMIVVMFLIVALLVRNDPPPHMKGIGRPLASAPGMYSGVSPDIHAPP